MTNWIDFKELRKQLDFEEVLKHYAVELKITGAQHHGFCPLPLHKGRRNSASFSANIKRGIWQCFGCGERGNILDFAVLMEGANRKDGAEVRRIAVKLRETLSADRPAAEIGCKDSAESDEREVFVNAPLDFELKGLEANHQYLLGRGFSEETIARFGLGYCSRGILAKRIAIPLHNLQGRLVGYAGRLVEDAEISEENPKYRFPGRRERSGATYDFRKSLLLYNAHRIPSPVRDLLVVEGFASVWWLSQTGLLVSVSTMGASCSEEQGRLVASLVRVDGRVWIISDGDEAGERWSEEIFRHVAKRRSVRLIALPDGRQPTDLAPNELHHLFSWMAPCLERE